MYTNSAGLLEMLFCFLTLRKHFKLVREISRVTASWPTGRAANNVRSAWKFTAGARFAPEGTTN